MEMGTERDIKGRPKRGERNGEGERELDGKRKGENRDIKEIDRRRKKDRLKRDGPNRQETN